MTIGLLCASANGAAMPTLMIILGQMTDAFVDNGRYVAILDVISAFLTSVGLDKKECVSTPSLLSPYLVNISANYQTVDISIIQKQIDTDFLDTLGTHAIILACIGCGIIVLGYGQVAFWSIAAERQCHRIRSRFFRNLLRQEIGRFDTYESGQLNTSLSENINKIHDAIGDKLGSFFKWFGEFVSGYVIGFVYDWKLTLVTLSVSPAIIGAAYIYRKISVSMSLRELKAYAKAGAIAEEVLSCIRTVVAFGGQKKECDRYFANLENARDAGIKKGLGNGISMGLVNFVVFCSYALGFWYGAKLIREEPGTYTIGICSTVFFCVLIGSFSIGQAYPYFQSFLEATGAACAIFEIIDLILDIDSSSDNGKKPHVLHGNITFSNVHFSYPARQGVKVLNGVNLEIREGQTVALVGSSGCGKSTLVQLTQRFYDPKEGQVTVDGNDVKDLNLRWLREHIGVVSQEPILFATTIAESIRFGKDGVSQAEIEAAAKMANAHNFISELPDKYETIVGERGAQLSGGQKQRVAIARALIRDPKILLLDEATSALDTESEAVVQEALDKARAGRTTLVVAHRLSTIKTADIIAGFKDGLVVEKGSHDQLMQMGGVYQQLVTLQSKKLDDEEDELIKAYMQSDRKTSLKQTWKKRNSSFSVTETEGLKHEKGVHKKCKNHDETKGSFRRIIRLSFPEWYLIIFGCLASFFFGAVQPAFAVMYSGIVGVFKSTDYDYQQIEIRKYVLLLCGLGLGCFLSLTAQGYLFGRIGENLTLRLRKMVFRALLRQEIAYFDDPENSTGALTTRLATEASQVHGASGVRIGKLMQNFSTIGTAIAIAFIYGWKLAFVILAFLPLMALYGALQMKILAGVAGKNSKALANAGKIATEGIENIRTVAGLGMEDMMFILYVKNLEKPYRDAMRKFHLAGLAFSLSQSMLYFAFATSFYFGAYLVTQNEMEFEEVFRVFAAIVFGGSALGEASAFAPDASKAKVAAEHIFALLDRVPVIDCDSENGRRPSSFNSVIKFRDCKFCYPTRLDVEVLQGLTLSVAPGETLALVGASGCGKSTIIQSIERFYDPEEGNITLDGYRLKELNIQWLRSKIGIVSQEPILLDKSIADNIAYGDNSRIISMAEIINAARRANIHRFIESLPNGYDTNVGSKGTQLSGGQKQRVAIARALVRNPKILLLDEATSALDTESERVVQEALDKAREGRTCIVIAHRLSTIRNADKICVIKHGQMVEEGRHGDLMSKQGIYYRLNTAQASEL